MAAANGIVKIAQFSSLDSATFAAPGYFLLFTFPEPCFFLRIVNNSDTLYGISLGGEHTNDHIRAGSELEMSSQDNSLPNGHVALFQKGAKIYVFGSIAGIGSIYATAYYV